MPWILLLLAGAWCVYLVLWWRDSRKTTGTTGVERIESFNSGLSTLAGSVGPWSPRDNRARALRPRSAIAAARRRRQVLAILLTAAVVSLLAAVVFGPIAIAAHVAVDLVLAAYAYGCWRCRNIAAEREIKVRMLYPDGVVQLHPGSQAQLYAEQAVYADGNNRVRTG